MGWIVIPTCVYIYIFIHIHIEHVVQRYRGRLGRRPQEMYASSLRDDFFCHLACASAWSSSSGGAALLPFGIIMTKGDAHREAYKYMYLYMNVYIRILLCVRARPGVTPPHAPLYR